MHRWMAIDFFLLVESTICRISKSIQRRIQRYNERHLILFETFFCFQGLKVWHQIIGISLANFPSFIWIFVNFFFVILLLVCWNLIYTIFWVIFFYIFRVVGYSNYNGVFFKNSFTNRNISSLSMCPSPRANFRTFPQQWNYQNQMESNQTRCNPMKSNEKPIESIIQKENKTKTKINNKKKNQNYHLYQ